MKKRFEEFFAQKKNQDEKKTLLAELQDENSAAAQFMAEHESEIAEHVYEKLKEEIPTHHGSSDLNASESERMWHSIQSQISRSETKKMSWLPRLSLVAAGLVVGIVATQFVTHRNGDVESREKGAPTQQHGVELVFNVTRNAQGRPLVSERGQPGNTYAPDDKFILQFRLPHAGHVCLATKDSTGAWQALTDGKTHHSAGWNFLKDRENAAAFVSGAPSGIRSFVLAFDTQPLECPQAASDALAHKKLPMAVDSFEVVIQ